MPMPTDIGIVDLGMGFPYQSIEEKKRTYDFFRANLKDKQSLEETKIGALKYPLDDRKQRFA